MPRVMIIGPKEKEAIQGLVSYAEKHHVDKDLIQKCMKKEWAVGDDPNYIAYIEQGYRLVYSIEEQPRGWFRHLSVSVDNIEKAPHPAAVELLMKEFGFKGSLDYRIWMEKNVVLSTGIEVNAINILQEYDHE